MSKKINNYDVAVLTFGNKDFPCKVFKNTLQAEEYVEQLTDDEKALLISGDISLEYFTSFGLVADDFKTYKVF